MNAQSRRTWAAATGAIALAGALVVAPTAASAASGDKAFTAKKLSADTRVSGAKSATGRIAQSDPQLLKRSDTTMVNVVIKLDYDALAAYKGGLKGLAATSPSVTKKALTGRSTAEVAYAKHIAQMDKAVRDAIKAKVPSARLGKSLTVVYGGVVARIPAKDARTVLGIEGVAAVQTDPLNKPEAVDEAPQFMGAPAVWSKVGGQQTAGKGVIYANLDSGVWPEHPMLADRPDLGAPPAAPSGQPRACDFGDNPLTPEADVFSCNNKLIGGQPFLDSYLAINPDEVYTTARDSDGHGTHTTTTSAGNYVASAKVFGVERGPISGVAPGAWVMEYKVCGEAGCYGSDTSAAVGQAILDGAHVINYSISGGTNPYSDPTELAFLDAYDAGVFVAASAGNDGPGAGTVNHFSPWTTTVAASTQRREFQSTLTLTSPEGNLSLKGASITSGVSTATDVVMAEDIPGYDVLCSTELPAGAAEGKIVACQRGVVGRVQKGYNVKAGGAVGMILYNLPLQDVETDNHWLPTVHLADGTEFRAYMDSHTAVKATLSDGQAVTGSGNVMAAFSSRGPGGQFLKPDITAPGVQVLAGQTPTPDSVTGGPEGEYYMAIAGTSMSSPNVAGSAILIKALKPSWTPGAIKSALMTTARQNVVKEDESTPADPLDFGAGHVDLTKAGRAPVVFDASTADMVAAAAGGAAALNLNLPSINVPTMPGSVVITRTATNVSGKPYSFTAYSRAPAQSGIRVSPKSGTIPAGGSQTFTITIRSWAPEGQHFGAITLRSSGNVPVRLPVAFVNAQGSVKTSQECASTTIKIGEKTTCTVTVENAGTAEAMVSARSIADDGLTLSNGQGARVNAEGKGAVAGPVTLASPKDAVPAIAPATDSPAGGFLDLADFGIGANPIGDEDAINFDIPEFVVGGRTYNRIGVVSNGYAVLGGVTGSSQIQYLPQNLPDPAEPNGLLSPYWTDLDGGDQTGVSVGLLGDGVNNWVVLQWDVAIFGDSSDAGKRSMQVWIGVNGTEDVTYEYAANALNAGTPADTGLTIGAESHSGTEGAMIAGLPTGSYRVTSSPGAAGGVLSYTVDVTRNASGPKYLTTYTQSDTVTGTTRTRTLFSVNPR